MGPYLLANSLMKCEEVLLFKASMNRNFSEWYVANNGMLVKDLFTRCR
jgi:hypothetical protein